MDSNVIYCGDCKDVLKKIPDESVDLIYLDPPFFSQKHYENFWIVDQASHFKFSDKDWEKLRHSIDPNILKEYEGIEKRWKGGTKGIYVYIAYMRERLIQCERVLKKTGTIYLHCDWHAGHYLKVMMDELFGYENFLNEIVWRRQTAHSDSKQQMGRIHDVIFFYSKAGGGYTWNQLFAPYSKEYIDNFYKHVEKNTGRRYQLGDLTGPGGAAKGNPEYEVLGVKRPWRFTKEKMMKLLAEGRIIQAKPGAVPRYKRYLDEMPGVPLQDVWDDIGSISGHAKERLGYPTQKPEALLERIIKISSNEGDLVLDPFCGCGTTLTVAKRLNRKWVGIDISRTACDVMKKRLGGHARVIGGESEEELRAMEPHEFARLVIVEKMNGTVNPKKSADLGIDGWIDFKTVPVQVKRWGHKVGRPEIDKFRTTIQRDKKERGIIVAFEFSRDSYNEVARIEKEDKIKIELKEVLELFK